jgi:hypothetical protein
MFRQYVGIEGFTRYIRNWGDSSLKDVNIYFVTALLNPLTGGADDDEEVALYRETDPDNEQQMRTVIRDRLKPYFKRFDVKSAEIAKASLQYLLSDRSTDFLRLYGSCLLPISPPSEPRHFFEWLWNELFDGREYKLISLDECRIDNDVHAPNLIQLTPE